ncbi:MAG: DUF1302 domain-containing protein [Alphaproteobacteria bacterium]|nr:MAG: DUF1302 domain-containing protein [Alphaproteobacteria bacterium]
MRRLLASAAIAALSAPMNAVALEWTSGETSIRFDTTLSLGAAWRVQDRDRSLIGVANGGSAYSLNADDGNLNYGRGLISFVPKATHDLEVKYRGRHGLFVRTSYFWDFVQADRSSADRTRLTDAAVDRTGRAFSLLDAYAFTRLDLGGLPLDLRIGQQVLSWGESTFIPNGINIISPFDVGKLRQAGAELKEAFLPVPMISASLGLTPNLRVEGFWQVRHRNTELEPLGTPFSTNDVLSPGAQTAFLAFGLPPSRDTLPFSPGTAIARDPDRDAKHANQFGVAARLLVPALNDTEFGVYFINYNSRAPILSARTGSWTNPLTSQVQLVGSSRYFAEYPNDIQLYGGSFNTSLPGGISLQGEIAYRTGQPLQIDDSEMLFSALSSLPGTAGAAFSRSQLGPTGQNREISGFRRHDVITAQATATKVFSQVLGADQLSVVGEVGFTQVRDMPSKGVLRYEGPGANTSGNPFFTSARLQPATQGDGFADGFSWGYRLSARLDYSNAIGPIAVSPSASFAHDVSGTTPLPLGTFVDGRMAATVGVSFNYLSRYTLDLSYTRFWGAGDKNLLSDRDFVAAVGRFSF